VASPHDKRYNAASRRPPLDLLSSAAVAQDWARPVVHWEIEAHDPGRLREFYAAMFNWNIGDGPIMSIAAGVGGPEPGPSGHLRQSDRRGVTLYVQVRDLRESLARVGELGGTVVTDPFDVPGGPTLTGIADPEGNPVVLVQQ
jgi:predicted enzyme related to lactoylglutathione lyase